MLPLSRHLRIVAAAVFAVAAALAVISRSRLIDEHGRPGEGPLGPFLLFGFWALAHLALVSVGLLRVRTHPAHPGYLSLARLFYLAQGAGHLAIFAWFAVSDADPTGGIPYAAVAASSYFIGPAVALAGLWYSRRGSLLLLGELVPAMGLVATILTGTVYA